MKVEVGFFCFPPGRPSVSQKGGILESCEERITTEAINVDNKAGFRYPDDDSFGLMEASIC
jgi:hypothetical protein